MIEDHKTRVQKVSNEIRRQQIQEDHVIGDLLRSVNDVQEMVNETKHVFERIELFKGRELVLTALNVLNTRLGIARMRHYRETLTRAYCFGVSADSSQCSTE